MQYPNTSPFITVNVTEDHLALLAALAEEHQMECGAFYDKLIRDTLYQLALKLAADVDCAAQMPQVHEVSRRLVLFGPTPPPPAAGKTEPPLTGVAAVGKRMG